MIIKNNSFLIVCLLKAVYEEGNVCNSWSLEIYMKYQNNCIKIKQREKKLLKCGKIISLNYSTYTDQFSRCGCKGNFLYLTFCSFWGCFACAHIHWNINNQSIRSTSNSSSTLLMRIDWCKARNNKFYYHFFLSFACVYCRFPRKYQKIA